MKREQTDAIKELVRKHLNELGFRERTVIRNYYGINSAEVMSFEVIGGILWNLKDGAAGVSRTRVAYIKTAGENLLFEAVKKSYQIEGWEKKMKRPLLRSDFMKTLRGFRKGKKRLFRRRLTTVK